MKYNLILGSVFLVLIFGCAHQHRSHHHSHHSHPSSHEKSDQRLRLNNGLKWKPDEILTRNVDKMHTQLVDLRTKEKAGKDSDKNYENFIALVSSSTEDIITNCRMSPDMDEVYHVILEKLLDSNEELKEKSLRKRALNNFVTAFIDYQNYFDHPLKH